MTSRRVYLALGSNLGDRREHLRAAIEELRAGGVAIDVVSALYETPPWGVEDQPAFLNIAVDGASDLDARALLVLAKRIEVARGPAHGSEVATVRWTARPLDIDIALIEGETVDEPDLSVPHVLLAERSFVLVPLAEIAGDVVHARLGRSIAALRDARPPAERDEVRQVETRGWESRAS